MEFFSLTRLSEDSSRRTDNDRPWPRPTVGSLQSRLEILDIDTDLFESRGGHLLLAGGVRRTPGELGRRLRGKKW